MTSNPQNKILPPKDASNFRAALKLYEDKQYKKALKGIDGVLKKNPDHGASLCLKGIVSYHLGKKTEGLAIIKSGLMKDITNSICWHILGLYYRNEKNYEEACKCYTKASKLDSSNSTMVRDLSFMQMQVRNYDALVENRKQILTDQPGYRMNWTGLAVAQHLTKNHKAALTTLTNFEELLQGSPSKQDAENSELLMYKNYVIYESGDVEGALKHLDEIASKVMNIVGIHEARAKYLLELGRNKDAERVFRILLKRNPECVAYYKGLEKALGVDEADVPLRNILYTNLAAKYPSAVAPKSIRLQFLDGASDDFYLAVSDYIKSFIERGVPAAFALAKRLYTDPRKQAAIHKFVETSVDDLNSDKGSETWRWIQNYKALHYSYLGNQSKALELIESAISTDGNDEENKKEKVPLELYLTKGKVLKHSGDLKGAAEVIDQVRAKDTSDRFLNTKTTKYLLRAGQMDAAIKNLSLFTRNDESGSGVADLIEMEALWFVIEQAESYRRLGEKNMALRRFQDVVDIFNTFHTDQFDFHFYGIRKGTVLAYLDLIQWEDNLFKHPIYIRAVKGMSDVYIDLFDHPAPSTDQPSKKKKAAVETPPPKDDDKDPEGLALLSTKDPLGDAYKIWTPLESNASDNPLTWEIVFEIYTRQKKLALACKALNKGKQAGVSNAWLISAAVRTRYLLENDETLPAALKAAQLKSLPVIVSASGGSDDISDADINQYLDSRVFRMKDKPTASEILYWVPAKIQINGGGFDSYVRESVENRILEIPSIEKVTLDDIVKGYNLLKSLKSEKTALYSEKAHASWPRLSIF